MTHENLSVFNHKLGTYQILKVQPKDLYAESICLMLCKELKISPAVQLLFALRIRQKSISPTFVPSCDLILLDLKYEFRLRFQLPNLSILSQRDKNAYDYLFCQMRYDLLNNNIPELVYPNHKDKVLGLSFTNMYIDVLEKKGTKEEIIKNFNNYFPKKTRDKHSIFLKKKIKTELEEVKMNHDAFYVKCTYVESVHKLSPNFLIEKYSGYQTVENFSNGTYPMSIEINPYSLGLTIFYYYNSTIKHISKIEHIYAISVDESANSVKLDICNKPSSVVIYITEKYALKSFVSCLSTFYRLIANWTIDICYALPTKSLLFLDELKIHGPIGYKFSYEKLLKCKTLGAYIIRQCEFEYDTFYIDIMTKQGFNVQPETFKILYMNSKWILHLANAVSNRRLSADLTDSEITMASSSASTSESLQTIENTEQLIFNSLPELVATRTKLITHRIPPSEFDRPPLLLLCALHDQLISKQIISEGNEYELRHKKLEFLDKTAFRQYIYTKELIGDGKFSKVRADWILDEHKKLEVTLKILNDETYLKEFMQLTNIWCNFSSNELTKLYGITLESPYTMVFESNKYGILQTFLQEGKHKISNMGLIDAAFQLAKALFYLQDNKFIHKRIRCSYIQVVRYDVPNVLLIRLSDPGFDKPYTTHDIPWIPIEYLKTLETAKSDPKAEVWAYATTLWEIFSQGNLPKIYTNGKLQSQPKDCPKSIFTLMYKCWQKPDFRLVPQTILIELSALRDKIVPQYQYLNGEADLEEFYEANCTDIAYKNISESSTTDDISSLDVAVQDNISYKSSSSIDSSVSILSPLVHTFNDDDNDSDLKNIIERFTAVDLPDGSNIVFQGCIGGGNYGVVFKGSREDYYGNMTEVAIKVLKCNNDKNYVDDFAREIGIMQKLEHPNIVRIISCIEYPRLAIIMEYVKNNSFAMYLSASRNYLSIEQYLRFANDIANGMQYLCSRNVVHRDLAARNILITEDNRLKIADFGLAQYVNNKGYYIIVTQTRELPIKWYAPEILATNKKYTHQSDVWSYGVTLIEMFTGGEPPNLIKGRELNQNELLMCIEKNMRLKKPQNCPDEIYKQLILPCWEYNPEKRPTFYMLYSLTSSLLNAKGQLV